jgi:hypothetical protein
MRIMVKIHFLEEEKPCSYFSWTTHFDKIISMKQVEMD